MFFNKLKDIARGLKTPPVSKIILYLFILATPLMLYPFEVNGYKVSSREIRQIMMVSMAIITCSYLQENRWLRYFIVWCVINWWLNFFIPASSSIGLFMILCALILYIGIRKLLDIGFLSADKIISLLCFGTVIQIIWMVLQAFEKDPIFYGITNSGLPNLTKGFRMPIVGWSGNPALLSASLAMIAFLFLYKGKVWFWISVIAIIFLKSFTGMLCLFASGLFYLFCQKLLSKKITLWIILSCITLGLFTIFIKFPNFDRIYIWDKLIHSTVNSRPIIGRGINFFSQLNIIDKTNTPWTEAHNDYLQMWLELGFIGVGLFMAFVVNIFKDFFSKIRSHKEICIASSLVAWLVLGISLFPMHLAQFSFYAIILLACLDRSHEIKLLQG